MSVFSLTLLILRLFASASFSIPGYLRLFIRSHPLIYRDSWYWWLVINILFSSATSDFPELPCFLLLRMTLSQRTEAKRKVWLSLKNHYSISKPQFYSHSNVLLVFCLVSIQCSSSKQQITSLFLMWGNNNSFPASCASGGVLASIISAIFLLTLSSLQGGVVLNF